MKWQDWALFLVIGIGAYACGFAVGKSPGLFFRVIADPPIQLRLVVDTLPLQFPKNPAVDIKVQVAKTAEEFSEAAKTSDLLLGRPSWLKGLDRKPLTIYRQFPELRNLFYPLFFQEAFQEQQIVPILWGVPELFAQGQRKWEFQPAELSGIVLGLILVDNPTVAKLTLLKSSQRKTLFKSLLEGLRESGLGFALEPRDPELQKLIPESQKATRAAEFELSRFEMKQ